MAILPDSLSTQLNGSTLLLGATDGTFSDAFALSMVGMCVVFSSLITLALIVWGMSKLMPQTEHAPTAKRSQSRGPSLDGGIDATTLAVIAAAATVAVGQAVEVKDVRPVD